MYKPNGETIKMAVQRARKNSSSRNTQLEQGRHSRVQLKKQVKVKSFEGACVASQGMGEEIRVHWVASRAVKSAVSPVCSEWHPGKENYRKCCCRTDKLIYYSYV